MVQAYSVEPRPKKTAHLKVSMMWRSWPSFCLKSCRGGAARARQQHKVVAWMCWIAHAHAHARKRSHSVGDAAFQVEHKAYAQAVLRHCLWRSLSLTAHSAPLRPPTLAGDLTNSAYTLPNLTLMDAR